MTSIPEQVRSLADGRSVILRPPRQDDAPGLLAFLEVVIADGDGQVLEVGESQLTLDDEVAWIRDHLDHPTKTVIVAEAAGVVVGLTDASGRGRRRLGHVASFGMAVRPEWRGAGLGGILLRHLIDWAEAHPSIEKLQLEVLSNNPRAIHLYERHGFVAEGRQRAVICYEPGVYTDSILMGRACNEDLAKAMAESAD